MATDPAHPAIAIPADDAASEPRLPSPLRRIGLDVLAIALALIGSALGLIGAFVQELQSLSGGIILIVVGAPVVEEVLKPTGVYLLLARWPQALRGRLHAAFLAALAGLVFGLIESWIYVNVYYTEGDSDYELFRYTVPVAMHALASFVMGMGLTRSVLDWAAGRGPLPRSSRNFFIAAIGLHAAYNLTAVVLEVSGVLEFE